MAQEKVSVDELTLEDGELFHDRKGRVKEWPRPLAPLAESHGHLTSFHRHDPEVAICRAALAGVRMLVVPFDPVDEVPRKFATAQEFLARLDAEVEGAARRIEECAEHGLYVPEFSGYDAPALVDNVRIVVGVHPYSAADLDDAALGEIKALLCSERCVGVGEIGLDFGPYNELGEDVQLRAFRAQLRLAHEHDLPVELHIRDNPNDATCRAHALAAEVLREEGVPARGCDLHCFTQGPEVMAPFVELGCHVAFGGAVTFAKSDDIRAAAAACPTGQILLETDSPYMAPVPLRGEECEPAMCAFTAGLLADVREEVGFTRQGTYDALWENARRLFSA
ncbi:TatD family hydrolase [Olsenella intestinalis]|uniref:TatD family hydrolase n=1 Tax=Olsenella intestinalis TaxID=2930083 RepID=UPI00200D33C9|nr:TatD family hydrolase [Olsenella intestinalis]